jgi:hypothetical protein
MIERLLIENPRACGMGEGAGCCAFLVAGGDGFECGKVDPGLAAAIRMRLFAGTMNAKYDPGDLPFPQCQPHNDSPETEKGAAS